MFRAFRPERNGIDNLGWNMMVVIVVKRIMMMVVIEVIE
jgi:hypothetical protein